MSDLLISGPAGAGKSQLARAELARASAPIVAVDFQALYAALLLLERGPDGRYPERESRHAFALPLTEYARRAVITGARKMDVEIVATNSDGDPARRAALLSLLRADATERVVDPGRAAVVDRLSVNGTLSVQCGDAIERWYGRL